MINDFKLLIRGVTAFLGTFLHIFCVPEPRYTDEIVRKVGSAL